MPNIQRIGDIELEQDLEFERRQWRVQRVGWAVWALIVLLALLGLLGPGPLSHTTVQSKSGALSAQFDRYDRASRESQMQIEIDPGAAVTAAVTAAGVGREIRLWIARDFVEYIRVARIEPEPPRTEVSADRYTYIFPVSDASFQQQQQQQRRQPKTTVFIHFEHDRPGRRNVRLGVAGAEEVAFRVFVYP